MFAGNQKISAAAPAARWNRSARAIFFVVAPAAIAALLMIPSHAIDPPQPKGGFPLLQIHINTHAAQVEVAMTPEQKARGLMFRQHLADNSGMLFIWSKSDLECLWMHNTEIPLSAAFIDAQGMIIGIVDLQPRSDFIHCADRPAPYALEMPQGWFARNGIAPGAYIEGLEHVTWSKP